MRLASKLFVLGAMAVAVLAVTAGSASAQFEVLDEDGDGGHCPEVTLLSGHAVQGGCELDVRGKIAIYAHIPAETPIINCFIDLEARIDENGEGYIESAIFTAGTAPPAVPCTRAPCDEANGNQLPWRFHLNEVTPGDEQLEMTFCLRTVASGPGGTGTNCEVHLELSDLSSHNYEIGHLAQHQFCEGNPIPPVSIVGHLESYNPLEEIEIIHTQP
jgi:hypothetical protein